MVQLNTTAGDGGLRVELDGFGSFGSNIGNNVSDAFYDPIGEQTEAGTTFESAVAIRVGSQIRRTFLTTGNIAEVSNLIIPFFDSRTTNTTTANSTFTVRNLDFSLNQVVEEVLVEGEQTGSTLIQTYTITNPSSNPIEFELIRYIDGDLDFDGSIDDSGGRLLRDGQEILFQTDSGENPFVATTFFSITATGGDTLESGRYEIDSFSGLRSRISNGTDLDDIITGDSDDSDQFIDSSPYDVSLALRNSFVLNPGASTSYVTTTVFGSGSPEALDELETVFTTIDNSDLVNGLAYDATLIPESISINMRLTQGVQNLGSEADFKNLVGLYAVLDINGGIDIDGDGNVDLLPTDEGYARAAIENRVDSFQILAGGFGDPNFNTTVEEFGDVLISGGQMYAPFLIANGGEIGFEGFIANEDGEESVFNNMSQFREDFVAYFAFIGANPDGTAHLQSRRNGVFGFEDLPSNLGMSDNDFNDAVFQLISVTV